MMPLRFGISGATGRMGKELAKLAIHESSVAVPTWCCVAERSSQNALSAMAASVDSWIDFSIPESTMALLDVIRSPVVIGTTGFSERQMEHIYQYSNKYPVLISGNMSFGIEVLRRMLCNLPKTKTITADVSIVEEHHHSKRDAPSGTAKMIEIDLREMGFSDVSIHSFREGGIVGVHRVRWVTDSEELEITHRAFDRSVFARGAVMAAEWLVNQSPGLYTISSIWRK